MNPALNSDIPKAIILAAGTGSRLKPFTEHLPKCLTPLNGVPILVNALTQLFTAGVRETIIVVGHLKEKIIDAIGPDFQGMTITYIESDAYARTNNIYSLWLAREYLHDDILLLEADVFFEGGLLESLLACSGKNALAVDRYQPHMSGTVVKTKADGTITGLFTKKQQVSGFDYGNAWKTINISLLRKNFLEAMLLPDLEDHIQQGIHGVYYEVLLQKEQPWKIPGSLVAVPCEQLRWYEIDDEHDRAMAEYLFASQEQRYELIQQQHGGFFRYPFVDHAYLYNLYFPPDDVIRHFESQMRELVLHYPSGQQVLTELMGGYLDTSPEHLLVCNGTSEIIRVLGRKLCRKMIVPVPSFNEYLNAPQPEKVIPFKLRAPDFQLNVQEFFQAIEASEADLAILVNPNNPTSQSIPKESLVWLLDQLQTTNCQLVVDESFMDFVDDPPHVSVADLLEKYPWLSILKSLSKSYGICGLRLGYFMTANPLLMQELHKEVSIWNINGFAEAFLRILPRYREDFEESVRKVRADRDDLYEALGKIPGASVLRPQANYIFCHFSQENMMAKDLARMMFVQHNILIKSCAEKMSDPAHEYYRIACRTHQENQRLVEALTQCLQLKNSMLQTTSPKDLHASL
ncbi:MAG: aminotransferase class I/II-fold pyridoxal phosphate-dependent enzyme [SAR324 cluster bacterium]|nr:aminotransferase class I/II-fold pyridoxal phosphate-dependent enzyme [SAR324 cluster bacterium]